MTLLLPFHAICTGLGVTDPFIENFLRGHPYPTDMILVIYLRNLARTIGRNMERDSLNLSRCIFLKLAYDNVEIENPRVQNREIRGFGENRFCRIFPHEKTTLQWSKAEPPAVNFLLRNSEKNLSQLLYF